jgi:hypothetical protein
MSDPTPAEKEYYYADADAKPVGPQSAEKLRDLRHRGILTDETLVIEVAGTEWVAYRSLGKGVTLPPVPVPAKGSFLALKRTATALILFVLLAAAIYLVAFYGSAAVIGLNMAFQSGDLSSGHLLSYYNGGKIQASNASGLIAIISLAVGILAAIAISFSNVLPWCRRSQAHRLAKR